MDTTEITVQGQRFVDAAGRQVILHGINWVNKDPKTGYLSPENPEFYARLHAWGLNCLRLGVIWDGLEPQPGVFNTEYLQGLDRQVDLAHQHGLAVILDMHQDLYSVLFADGAPAWATITHGAPHLAEDGIWSDAYFSSPAVQAALDSFWENAPAPDGVGLQDHYAQAWSLLAQRFAHHPEVIGFDLMNEPFPGALGAQILETLFASGARLLAGSGALPGLEAGSAGIETLIQHWHTPEGRFALLQALSDPAVYAAVVDSTQSLYNDFERTQLMSLYTRVARAIRSVEPRKSLLLETTMGSNMGVYSAIQPLTRADGSRDPYQVYAAHGYDLVTDTPYLAKASPERVRLIFQRHAQTARRLDMPMLVGEWGAYGDAPDTLPAALQVVGIFEELLCSETYWAYFPGVEAADNFRAVHRPYPERVAGLLLSYHFNPQSGIFSCTWQEDGATRLPSRIYLPDWFGFDPSRLQLAPYGAGFQVVPVSPGSGNLYLEIPPTGQDGRRELLVQQGR